MTDGTTTALVVWDQGIDPTAVDGKSVIVVPVVNVTDSGVQGVGAAGRGARHDHGHGPRPDYTLTITVS